MNAIGIILGGGVGSRLKPLTTMRAKPAVPIAGKYRLVDVPLSNCINSKILRIFLLTQYNSASLHRHIQSTYQFDQFSEGFVQLLAAEQTPDSKEWFQGTADAVRQSMHHLANMSPDYVVILSGDQLFKMDFRDVINQHIISGADLTICNTPVSKYEATDLGILRSLEDGTIDKFYEKPDLRALTNDLADISSGNEFLASMGVYVFNFSALKELLLESDGTDFGTHIIPQSIETHRVFGYTFRDYWKDIGTIRSFWKANIELSEENPAFCFYDGVKPIFTRPRFLPPSRIVSSTINNCLLADGIVVSNAEIKQSVVGLRSIVGPGTSVYKTVIMGNDYYKEAESKEAEVPLGIGKNCHIERSIIDKNVCIGNNVVISPMGLSDVETDLFSIKDGIVIIPKGAVLPDNWSVARYEEAMVA